MDNGSGVGVLDKAVLVLNADAVLEPGCLGALAERLRALAGLIVFWFNTRKARPELGSEIELAPNRKPYFDDEKITGFIDHQIPPSIPLAIPATTPITAAPVAASTTCTVGVTPEARPCT